MEKRGKRRANSHFDFNLNGILDKSKRSQAGIISVVLLILVVIIATGIVIAFVIPFVKDKLSSGDCVDVAAKVTISSSAYTCYYSNNTRMQVQVGIEAVRELIDGFSVELGGPSSQSFKLINGTNVTGVTMYGGGLTIDIPGDNQERTYFFNDISPKPDFIKVYPILENGKVCGVSDTATTIDNC